MGFALAERLTFLGAHVMLVCGPVNLTTNNPSIQRIDVTSADQMYEACIQYFESCDGAIMTAAVADYAPVVAEKEKIKRSKENWQLELRPNKDIAAELGRLKKSNPAISRICAGESERNGECIFKTEKEKSGYDCS